MLSGYYFHATDHSSIRDGRFQTSWHDSATNLTTVYNVFDSVSRYSNDFRFQKASYHYLKGSPKSLSLGKLFSLGRRHPGT